MTAFPGPCFSALCGVCVPLNLYAARRRSELPLSAQEVHRTRTSAMTWAGSAGIGLLSALIAKALPPPRTPFAGSCYALLGIWIPLFGRRRLRAAP